MKLSNYEVPRLMELLFNMKLKKKESRMRSRLFIKLNEYVTNTLNREELDLLAEYGEKDSEGHLIPSEYGGFKLIPETAEEYHKQFGILQNEFYFIEETESNKDMLLSVANSILECDLELEGEIASLYDKWCEQFEELIETYNKQ